MTIIGQLLGQAQSALMQYGKEALEAGSAYLPAPSHICFKFASGADFHAYGQALTMIAQTASEEFNGKTIIWGRCHIPFTVGDEGAPPVIEVLYVELVEPRDDFAPVTGVSSLGFAIAGDDVVKMKSDDGKMVFRFQPQHASHLMAAIAHSEASA
jgi:hypothetical protein